MFIVKRKKKNENNLWFNMKGLGAINSIKLYE